MTGPATPVLALAALLLGWAGAARAEPEVRLETLASGLEHPWSLAFLPGGGLLVTERPGRIRVIGTDGEVSPPIEGVPPVYEAKQAGFMEALPHPDFPSNRLVYLSYVHGTSAENRTRVARARFDGAALADLEVLLDAVPAKATAVHNGGRMAFLPDNTLLVAIGEGFDTREEAQRLTSHLGSIVRLADDGSVPPGNPFAGKANARPEIWSYGHRNPQGIVYDPESGLVYEHEHGPRGGDELNLIEPGRNYGWPITTYGLDYSGALVTPYTEYPGMVQPLIQWSPSIAPSGMTLYRGAAFPEWSGDLFVTALVEQSVRRIDLEGGAVAGQEILFRELGARLRDVRSGPDGFLYILTDEADGKVIRVRPAD